MNQETLIARETPEQWIAQAKERWSPIRTFCLFSGGNDSGVLAHCCRDHYDALAYIDTGLAVPGVEQHVRDFAEWLDKPLEILRSGDAYRTMVLGDALWWERFEEEKSWNPEITVAQAVKERIGSRRPSKEYGSPPFGFPGKGQHGRAYIRLKERRIEDLRRQAKQGHPRTATVLFLSGVRRDESARRATRPALSERRSAKYCNPLIDWTNAEVRAYREEFELPESDIAALLHRSGECNCGAFADTESERAMLKSLWPEWWANTIEALEAEAEARGIRYCRWGGYDLEGNQAARKSIAPGLLCSNCVTQPDPQPEQCGGSGEGRGQ